MIPYSQFSPTCFDQAGYLLPDQQDWLVVPCSRTRDSDLLEESNFDTALELLGGESPTVEVVRFGHWGPGWFEIILVKPGTKAEEIALLIEGELENYPALDEDDWCEREYLAIGEYWDNDLVLAEKVQLMHEKGDSVFAARASSHDLYYRAPHVYYYIQEVVR